MLQDWAHIYPRMGMAHRLSTPASMWRCKTPRLQVAQVSWLLAKTLVVGAVRVQSVRALSHGREVFTYGLTKLIMTHCQALSVSGMLGTLMLIALRISSSPCFSPSDMSSPGAMIFDLIDLNDDCHLHPTEVAHARAMFEGDAMAEQAIQLSTCAGSRGTSFECIERAAEPLCFSVGPTCETDADCAAPRERCVSCRVSAPQTATKTCETTMENQGDCPVLLRLLNITCYESGT